MKFNFFCGLPFLRKSRSKFWQIMKLNAIFLLATCLQVSAKNYSQVVTLEVKNATLENVFKEVQKQTGYNFVYNNRLINKANRVDVKAVEMPVDELLRQCFKDQPLAFSVFDKTIVVKPKSVFIEKIELREIALMPPPLDVKGRVVNETGEPLAGASVKIKGTETGTARRGPRSGRSGRRCRRRPRPGPCRRTGPGRA